MRRTYIPTLLRMAEEMRLYLGKNQRNMSEAAQLNPEQREILSTLHKALQDLDMKIGVPLFPECYQSKSRPRPFDPQDEPPRRAGPLGASGGALLLLRLSAAGAIRNNQGRAPEKEACPR